MSDLERGKGLGGLGGPKGRAKRLVGRAAASQQARLGAGVEGAISSELLRPSLLKRLSNLGRRLLTLLLTLSSLVLGIFFTLTALTITIAFMIQGGFFN